MARVPMSISFQEDVLKKLDYYAKQQGVTRSRLVNLILREKLGLPPMEDDHESDD